MGKKNRTTDCSCGSGKKYKKCCYIRRVARTTLGTATSPTEDLTDLSIIDRAPGLTKKRKIWHRKVWLG